MRRRVSFLLVSLPLLAIIAVAWRVDRAARRGGATGNAKAIVMLGARVLPSGRAAPALQYRAQKAAELYREGRAPLVIFSGGSGRWPPSEASVGRELAVAAGVPEGSCLVEDQSHSTHENALFTAPLLKERGIDEVLLVSDGYHLLRAQAQFERLGIKTLPVPSGRRLGTWDALVAMVREAISLLSHPWLLF